VPRKIKNPTSEILLYNRIKVKKPKNHSTKAYEKWELRSLKKRCLRLWSQVVKKKAGYKCEHCGSVKFLNSHHIESFATNSILRYDERNGVCCCAICHKWGVCSFHRSFVFAYNFMITKRKKDIKYLQSFIGKEKVEHTKDYFLAKIRKFEKIMEE
jgi:hypothetical protein